MKFGRPTPPFVKKFHKIPFFFRRWLPLALKNAKEKCNFFAKISQYAGFFPINVVLLANDGYLCWKIMDRNFSSHGAVL